MLRSSCLHLLSDDITLQIEKYHLQNPSSSQINYERIPPKSPFQLSIFSHNYFWSLCARCAPVRNIFLYWYCFNMCLTISALKFNSIQIPCLICCFYRRSGKKTVLFFDVTLMYGRERFFAFMI